MRAGMSRAIPMLTAVYAVWRSEARLYAGVGTDGSNCWGGVYSKERCCFNVSTAAPTKATPAPTLDGIASALLMPSMNSRSKPGRVLRCSLRCRFCDVACPRASELPEPLENAAAYFFVGEQFTVRNVPFCMLRRPDLRDRLRISHILDSHAVFDHSGGG